MNPHINRVSFNLQVTYQTELFLDKNKDYVVAEHQALLSASECSFVSGLFPPLAEESSKSSKFSSIGSRFKVLYSSLYTSSSNCPLGSATLLCIFWIVILIFNYLCSNNCKLCSKLLVLLSHTTFVA